MEFSINFIPVIIIAVLYMPLGAYLYSEKGLGKMWLKAIKKERDEINPESGEMMKLMGGALLSSLLTVYFLGVLIASVGVATWSGLLLVILIVYLVLFFVRLKGTLFEGNYLLFKVNMIATLSEFVLAFVVFLIFLLV